MRKFEKVLLSVTLVMFTAVGTGRKDFKFEGESKIEVSEKTEATAKADIDAEKWDKFIEAVIWQESKGKENCIGDSGKAVGVLQIHPIMVREANRILAMTDKSKSDYYAYDDRYDREKSIEIFKVVQDYHNASHDHKRALEIWNKNHPKSYYTQIMAKYNELIS